MKSKFCLIKRRGLTNSIQFSFQIWKHITFQWVIMFRNFGNFGRKVTKSTVYRIYHFIITIVSLNCGSWSFFSWATWNEEVENAFLSNLTGLDWDWHTQDFARENDASNIYHTSKSYLTQHDTLCSRWLSVLRARAGEKEDCHVVMHMHTLNYLRFADHVISKTVAATVLRKCASQCMYIHNLSG